MKLGKTLKNMGEVLAKIVKKSIFSKMKLISLIMKNHASFHSRIYLVFSDLNAFSGNTSKFMLSLFLQLS